MTNEIEKRIISSLIILPIALFFILQGSVFFVFFLSLSFFITSFEWLNMNKKKNSMKIIGLIFLLFSFYSAFFIRENLGLYFFLFIILVCIFTDIGGYIFGKIFKGPKLSTVSPNKTYSGMIGSFLTSLMVGLIFINLTEMKLLMDINNLILLSFILLISLISQIGDLVISYFKRKANLKDTGKILPGHGGLLDRLDGLVFVTPTVYLLNFFI